MDQEYNVQVSVFIFIVLIYLLGLSIYKTYTDKLPSILSILSQFGTIQVSAVLIILIGFINIKLAWICLVMILLVNLLSISILLDGF